MARPMSCRIGLRSCPSSGAGSSRAKGLEVKQDEEQEGAEPIQPCTASTRGAKRARQGSRRRRRASAPKRPRISTHSSIEPSWLPHTPVTLKSSGFAEWLFSQTFLHREIRGHVGRGQRREGERDAAEARRPPCCRETATSRASPPAQPEERHASTGSAPARAPAPARSGRARRPTASPLIASAPLAFLPDAPAPSARRRPRFGM